MHNAIQALLVLLILAGFVEAQTITSLSPASTSLGAPTLTLTVNGTGFTSLSVIQWDGANQVTTFVSSTRLTTTIAASLLTFGTHSVRVRISIFPTAVFTNTLPFTVGHPVPTLSSVQPAGAVVLSSSAPLTLTGTGFHAASVVEFSQSVVNPSFVSAPITSVSATSLQATLPASALGTVGALLVRVRNPAPGGGISASQQFSVVPQAPTISSLNPSSVIAGAPATILQIFGTGLHLDCRVNVGSALNLVPFLTAGSSIGVAVPGTQFSAVGIIPVQVINTLPGGQGSNILNLNVTGIIPVITSVSSNGGALLSNQGGFLTVTGSNFLANAVARIDGVQIPISNLSATNLSLQVPANTFNTPATRTLTIENAPPTGGVSIGFPLVFTNPGPLGFFLSGGVGSLSNVPHVLTINGTGFCAQTVVLVDEGAMPVTTVTSTSISFVVPGSMTSAVRVLRVRFSNPPPGGGSSGEVSVNVGNLVAATLTPASMPALTPTSAPFPISILGTNFSPTHSVRVNGLVVPSTFISASVIDAQIPPTVPGVQSPGCVSVSVHAGLDFSSNGLALPVGSSPLPQNRGVVRLCPVPPAPGESFGIAFEVPSTGIIPFTLLADLAPTPASVLTTSSGLTLALGVSLLAPIPLRDGLGIFGPASGAPARSTASLSAAFNNFTLASGFLDGLTAPLPLSGLTFTLQAVWPDSTAPGGLNLTSISGPHTL